MFRSMKADEYVDQRVNQFVGWYDRKAVKAKAAYLRIRTIAVVGALVVPVAANLDFSWYQAHRTIVTTLISLLVSIAVALDSVYHFADQWRNYRSTEQFLSREKFPFQTGEGPYKETNEEEAFLLFVERCEAQIASENSATLNVIATLVQQSTQNEAKT